MSAPTLEERIATLENSRGQFEDALRKMINDLTAEVATRDQSARSDLGTDIETNRTQLKGLIDAEQTGREDDVVQHMPVGSVISFAGRDVPPESSGWLPCNGKSFLREGKYEQLCNVIMTNFGTDGTDGADGALTFRVPDLSGRVIVGINLSNDLTQRAIATPFGEETHRLTATQLPQHQHTQPSHHHTWLFPGGGANINTGAGYNTAIRTSDGNFPGLPIGGTNSGNNYITSDAGADSTSQAVSIDTADDAFSIEQPSLVMHYLIRWK